MLEQHHVFHVQVEHMHQLWGTAHVYLVVLRAMEIVHQKQENVKQIHIFSTLIQMATCNHVMKQ